MQKLLTGNEAIAQGAYEAGVHIATSYPGTPSTEILENIIKYKEIYSEWCSNEKVALEVAIGASVAGARSIVSMKHVGLNVAADPLFTFVYMGCNAGCVIVSADEPGQFSSQNEQDNRNYAKAAKIPMFEPSDSEECRTMVREAFHISEQYKMPVLIRITTRISHSKSLVNCDERQERKFLQYTKAPQSRVCVPANAKVWRKNLEEKLISLKEISNSSSYNVIENNNSDIGVISSGICFLYAKEFFSDSVSYLKLGFTYPIPEEVIDHFCKNKKMIYVIEETDPYIEETVKKIGYQCHGSDIFPAYGEKSTAILRQCIGSEHRWAQEEDIVSGVIKRPPSFCSGCPHRGFFHVLGQKKDIMITGDIGCYTLAYPAPYNAMDTALCMGASFSMGHGAQKVFELSGNKKRVVAVLGDSTFFHSGINSLINTVYNDGKVINVILDNRTTGMTGNQENPGTGITAMGKETTEISIEKLVRSFGIKHIRVIDPNNLKLVEQTLDELLDIDEASVIITKWPCVLKKIRTKTHNNFNGSYIKKYEVDKDKCTGCKNCTKIGCPSLFYDTERKVVSIDQVSCAGCGVCSQKCNVNCIREV